MGTLSCKLRGRTRGDSPASRVSSPDMHLVVSSAFASILTGLSIAFAIMGSRPFTMFSSTLSGSTLGHQVAGFSSNWNGSISSRTSFLRVNRRVATFEFADFQAQAPRLLLWPHTPWPAPCVCACMVQCAIRAARTSPCGVRRGAGRRALIRPSGHSIANGPAPSSPFVTAPPITV